MCFERRDRDYLWWLSIVYYKCTGSSRSGLPVFCAEVQWFECVKNVSLIVKNAIFTKKVSLDYHICNKCTERRNEDGQKEGVLQDKWISAVSFDIAASDIGFLFFLFTSLRMDLCFV